MNTAIPLTEEMQDNIANLRELLDEFEQDQGAGKGDESNQDHIDQAKVALETLEGHVGDLIP